MTMIIILVWYLDLLQAKQVFMNIILLLLLFSNLTYQILDLFSTDHQFESYKPQGHWKLT
jgi:hypothetical protein